MTTDRAELAMRPFPIQKFGTVPWYIAERAYEKYAAEYGTRQSLERLGERGGFGISEMDMFYPGWRDELSGRNELVATLSQREAEIGVLKEALKLHHEWHLNSGTIGLPDDNGGWIAMDNAAEYSDSEMCQRTIDALRTSSETGGAWVKVVEAAKPIAKRVEGNVMTPDRQGKYTLVLVSDLMTLKDALTALNSSEAG